MVATAIGECGIRRDNVYAYALVQWFGNGAGKICKGYRAKQKRYENREVKKIVADVVARSQA